MKTGSNNPNYRHGMAGSRLYRIWSGMKKRCLTVTSSRYQFYGAKGISVCDEWMNFDNFKTWALANNYNDTLTLDRINPAGNYMPENCRWETWTVQYRNKLSSITVNVNGAKVNAMDFADSMNLNPRKFSQMIQRGHSVESALRLIDAEQSDSFGYTKNGVRYKYDNVIATNAKTVLCTSTGFFFDTAKEAAKALGFNYSTLKSMLNGNNNNRTTLMYV